MCFSVKIQREKKKRQNCFDNCPQIRAASDTPKEIRNLKTLSDSDTDGPNIFLILNRK